jgi:hypothetical protein
MSLIGEFIYRGHHWMNIRGEALFSLTCVFDRYPLIRHDVRVPQASDLRAWIAVSFV